MSQFYLVKDYDEMSEKAAALFFAQITLKPDAVLGLATGSTPVGTYRQLTELCRAGRLDCSRVTTVNLDEYLGLSAAHPQSYRFFMREHLFDGIGLPADRTFFPEIPERPSASRKNETASSGKNRKDSVPDIETALAKVCSRYDELLRSLGGTDLQLLGIGRNGHIGFNEPGDVFIRNTHTVTLAENTRQANARFFDSIDDVPTHACTMGIGGIFSAKKILLLASGEEKAQALQAAFCGPVTPRVPASILQLHPDVTVIADKAAGQLLADRLPARKTTCYHTTQEVHNI